MSDSAGHIKRHQFQEVLPPRALSGEERHLMAFLLSEPFPGREVLGKQLESARVSAQCASCPTVTFKVERRASPPAPVRRRIPTEAESLGATWDPAGVHVLLHVVDGYLDELEVYRNDGEPIPALPSPESLELLRDARAAGGSQG